MFRFEPHRKLRMMPVYRHFADTVWRRIDPNIVNKMKRTDDISLISTPVYNKLSFNISSVEPDVLHLVLYDLGRKKRALNLAPEVLTVLTRKLNEAPLYKSNKEIGMLLYGLSALKFNGNNTADARNVLLAVRDLLQKNSHTTWNKITVSMAVYGLKNISADIW